MIAHPIPSNHWTLKKELVKQKIEAGGTSLKVDVGASIFQEHQHLKCQQQRSVKSLTVLVNRAHMCSERVKVSVQLFETPWTVACQAPPSMEFSRPEYLVWVAVPFSRDLPNPGMEPKSSVLQADSLPSEPPGNSTEESGLPCPPPGDLPNPGLEPRSPTLQADSLPTEPPGNPKTTGLGNVSLLQGIFPTQEMNWGLLNCRRILYHGSPTLCCSYC